MKLQPSGGRRQSLFHIYIYILHVERRAFPASIARAERGRDPSFWACIKVQAEFKMKKRTWV